MSVCASRPSTKRRPTNNDCSRAAAVLSSGMETPETLCRVEHRGHSTEINRWKVEGTYRRPGWFQFISWGMFVDGDEYGMASGPDLLEWGVDASEEIEALKSSFIRCVDEMLDGEPNGEG